LIFEDVCHFHPEAKKDEPLPPPPSSAPVGFFSTTSPESTLASTSAIPASAPAGIGSVPTIVPIHIGDPIVAPKPSLPPPAPVSSTTTAVPTVVSFIAPAPAGQTPIPTTLSSSEYKPKEIDLTASSGKLFHDQKQPSNEVSL
jgi:hypothetical protein